jgi:hypothetical protein
MIQVKFNCFLMEDFEKELEAVVDEFTRKKEGD